MVLYCALYVKYGVKQKQISYKQCFFSLFFSLAYPTFTINTVPYHVNTVNKALLAFATTAVVYK